MRAAIMPSSSLLNRNILTPKGRTSMRLEPELWQALDEICDRENSRLSELIQRIEAAGHPGGRTSAVRVFIVSYLRTRARAPSRAAGMASAAD